MKESDIKIDKIYYGFVFGPFLVHITEINILRDSRTILGGNAIWLDSMNVSYQSRWVNSQIDRLATEDEKKLFLMKTKVR